MSKLGQIHDVDLKTLRVFCTIVEEGGFSAAQTSLGLSQSSLSEYLKNLEIRLGMTLCRRGPKGFDLYEEGKQVYSAARDLLAAIDSFRGQVSNINNGAVGQVSIAVQDGIVGNPRSRMQDALDAFDKAFPSVRVKVEVMLGFQVLGRVADNLIPIGICARPHQHKLVSTRHLFDEVVVLYCSNKHPLFAESPEQVTIDRMREYRYSSRGHLEYTHPDWIEGAAYESEVGFGAEAQLLLILSGRTIGYLPDHIASRYVRAGILKQVSAHVAPRVEPVMLITGTGISKFRLGAKLLDFIVRAHGSP